VHRPPRGQIIGVRARIAMPMPANLANLEIFAFVVRRNTDDAKRLF